MHERITGLYEDNAAAWDRQRGRELVEKNWLDRFASLLPPGGTVLDIGCGSGEPIARSLIDLGLKLTGVDSSPSLIAIAQERFPEHEWLVGDMRQLQLARKFDGLIAWHSSFHLTQDDQRELFARFATHAAPRCSPAVHDRRGGRRGDRGVAKRADLPCEPCAERLRGAARRGWLRPG